MLIDFAIVTALDKERQAVCEAFGLTDSAKVRKQSRVYWRGRLPLKDGYFYELVAAQAPDMANVDAALLTNDTVHHWDPVALLLVGIAGAASDDVALGDVVLARDIYYYERGKVTSGVQKPEPVMYRADATLWNNVTSVPPWLDPIPVQRPDARKERPQIHGGVIASGEKVIAEEVARDQIAASHRKILAIEMEGYGFSSAVWQSFEHHRHLVIRAICDRADRNKSEDWQPYAAAVAAGFARHFLLDRPLDPRNHPALEENEAPDSVPVIEGFKWDVFISYSHRDQDMAARIHRALVERGLRVWLDVDEQLPADFSVEGSPLPQRCDPLPAALLSGDRALSAQHSGRVVDATPLTRALSGGGVDILPRGVPAGSPPAAHRRGLGVNQHAPGGSQRIFASVPVAEAERGRLMARESLRFHGPIMVQLGLTDRS